MGRSKKIYTFDEINAEAEKNFASGKRSLVESLEDALDDKDVEILKLKHDIVGYKAVISYLENQLGLGRTQ